MNKGIFITVAACLGFMALILALFLSRFYTPRELTLDEYKTLGAYFIDPPRQLTEFRLIAVSYTHQTQPTIHHV